MSKTIKEWFMDLPKEYRSDAIKSTKDSVLNRIEFSLLYAISVAYGNWTVGQKKLHNWNSICVKIKEGKLELPRKLGVFKIGDTVILSSFERVNGIRFVAEMTPYTRKKVIVDCVGSESIESCGYFWPFCAVKLVKEVGNG